MKKTVKLDAGLIIQLVLVLILIVLLTISLFIH